MSEIKLIVMGPAGVGKSTVGKAVAEKLGLPYIDGDALHPAANIAKMSKGTPLSDDDRDPWIANIVAELSKGGVVIGASLLKRTYRNKVHESVREVRFAQLAAPLHILAQRIDDREHFFRQDLLPSQMAILDPLERLEPGHVYDGTKPVATLVSEITLDLKSL
jgi:carbohydrate kinase (thermoresistant glucokinase family)